MSSPPKTKKLLFQLPSASEIQQRQRDLRGKAPISKFSSKSISGGVGSSTGSNGTHASNNAATVANVAAVRSGGAHNSITGLSSGHVSSRHSSGTTLAAPASKSRSVAGPAQASGHAGPSTVRNVTALGVVGNTARKQTVPAQAPRGPNAIVVNSCQRGNGVLNFIKNVPWEYGDIVADYQIGQTSCALFLSLKYHRLHPEYVYTRIKQLGHNYLLRVLLCLVDIDDHQPSIRDLTRICIYNNITLMLAWGQEEAGRYLETFKAYEHKPPDILKERVDPDYLAKLTDALTQIKSVNKTDVLTLASAFGSLENVIAATPEELAQCPGFGEQKVRRFHEAFNQPFLLSKKSKSTR